MSKSSQSLKALLFSSLGVVVMAVVLVAVNIILGQAKVRVDMTEENLYTLSKGTKEILGKLSSPVVLRFYCSHSQQQMPVALKSFAQRVEDLLDEYAANSKGKVRLEKYNPLPDSDAEDAAKLDGIDGQLLPTGEKLYLGLAITCVDQTSAIPVISPENENNLEYDITRAIYRVAHPEKIKVGIMSSMPVMGGPSMPMMGPQQQRQPAWVFVDVLKRDYDVVTVETSAEQIPDDIVALIVVHPKNLSDKTLYALDQFVLRGGRLVGLIDPMSVIDAQNRPPNQLGMMPPGASTLGPLLDAWGVKFDTGKVLIDKAYAAEQNDGRQRQVYPAILALDNRATNPDDITTGALDRLVFAFAGVLQGDGAEGLEKTVLVHSSADSQLVDTFKAQLPADAINKDFKADDKEYALAIRLVGTFKTAFPDGPPGAAENDGADEEAKDPGKDKDGDAATPKEPAGLKESTGEGAVILVADADFIHDYFWVRNMSLLGQRLQSITSDNNNLLQNAVEQLSGDDSLIGIRSRGVRNRPFVVVKQMQQEAEKRYREEINSLEEELSSAQQKLGELQRTKKDASQKLVLSPEQREEIEKFQKKEVEFRQRLKQVRKQLNRDVNSLETRLKVYNIALMPALVALSGLSFAFYRRRRMSSK